MKLGKISPTCGLVLKPLLHHLPVFRDVHQLLFLSSMTLHHLKPLLVIFLSSVTLLCFVQIMLVLIMLAVSSLPAEFFLSSFPFVLCSGRTTNNLCRQCNLILTLMQSKTSRSLSEQSSTPYSLYLLSKP
jgi:hypothetical protein